MIITQAAAIPFKKIKKKYKEVMIQADTTEVEAVLKEPKTKVIAGSVQNEMLERLKEQAKNMGANAILDFKMKYEMIQDTVTLVIYGVPAILTNEKLYY